VRLSASRPEEILLAINDRDPKLHDLYVVNLLSAERRLVAKNPGFTDWVADRQFVPRVATRPQDDGSTEVLRWAEGTWERLFVVSQKDALGTELIGLDAGSERLFAVDSRGRNTAALVAIVVATGDRSVLAESTQVDIERRDVLLDPANDEPIAVAYCDGGGPKKWIALGPSAEPPLADFRALGRGDIEVFGVARGRSAWLASVAPDNGAPTYYIWRAEGGITRLFTSRPGLAPFRLARMIPLEIPASDGLVMSAFLTLPAVVGEAAERPERPLSMVLLVHGGPWSRDYWGYNAFHQWLANRGYAVLSVNYRGSMGFGKSFLNAGNLEWGQRMQEDLSDAVRWAIAEGIADPARVAIMGKSYGGYAALAGLAFTPDMYAAAISMAGPSNLVTVLESIPAWWAPLVATFTTRVGDHRTPEGRARLLRFSPLQHVDAIRRPLLIAQGANDPRCKREESDRIADALSRRGIPVTYLLYPDEGHGFVRPANRLSFFAVAEAFLATHLGGRVEPLGNDLAQSSMQAVMGIHFYPDVEEAPR
jgi:dipeptidyl aminopeptidase/acylaminoacyl peptidase